uniref:CARMIL_C domain-containing protein n=1 Tax=Haemonchus contortus TaxID=6289 RepID=A0A7I5EC28_HAECO
IYPRLLLALLLSDILARFCGSTNRMSLCAIVQNIMMGGLEASEKSAFSPYSRQPLQYTNGDAVSPPTVIRPQPRLAVPLVPPQEDRSDSCIYKKIRSKRKERSSSVVDARSPSPEESTRSVSRSSPLPTVRANDFKKILQRFQIADKRAQLPRRFTTDSMRVTSPRASPSDVMNCCGDVWSPRKNRSPSREMTREIARKSSRELWSTDDREEPREAWSPAQRSSLNSGHTSSPTSRNTSARSRASMSSIQSPISFMPTRETSPRSMPSPSRLPSRGGTSSSSENPSSHSPFSHTGSTPEPVSITVRPAPLTVKVPTPKRRSLPARWIKESDIDDPSTLYLSPIDSPIEEAMPLKKINPLRSAPLPSSEQLPPNPRLGVPSRYSIGSCRKVLAGVDVNASSGMFMRRSRSKDERASIGISMSPCRTQKSASRSTLHSVPIFLSNESVGSGNRGSQTEGSLGKRSLDSPEDQNKMYLQMALSHVQTLSMVADRLANDMRRGEEPVSRNQLGQLEFSHFIIQSQHPILTKGKSLFYNAILPRPGESDYPVTLMIAPCSQYAPLMRKSGSQLFTLPGFLELEDQDGSISKFLHDTGTPNLDGRHTKVVALPRINLCSFHSLAAHHLNQRMDANAHEQLVSFIVLQLLAALKMLQSDGVEALSTNFKEFLLSYQFSPDSQAELWEFPRLIFLPETLGAEIESGGDELVGLCRYAIRALCTLLHHRMDGKPPPIKLRSRYSRALLACATILQEDKSSSLTKAKNVLETALWAGEHCRGDVEARIWLDMARAECVDALLRQLVCEPGCRLGARERYRVEFLLSATPRSLIESQMAIRAANI